MAARRSSGCGEGGITWRFEEEEEEEGRGGGGGGDRGRRSTANTLSGGRPRGVWLRTRRFGSCQGGWARLPPSITSSVDGGEGEEALLSQEPRWRSRKTER